MKNKGVIFAIDIDGQRLKTLQRTIGRGGARNVKTKRADFLEMDPNDPLYSKVKAILLDPSCSGSGTLCV